MSTTFAIIKENEGSDEKTRINIAHRSSAGNGKVNINWLNELALLMPESTIVHAMDNTQQGVKNIGDLIVLDKYGSFDNPQQTKDILYKLDLQHQKRINKEGK